MYILAVVTLCLVALAVFLGFYIQKISTTIASTQSRSEETTEMLRLMDAIKTVVKDTLPDVSQLSNYFVRKDGVVDLIERVESLGKGGGLEIVTKSVGIETKEEGGTEVVKLRLLTDGSWEQTLHFLTLLEELPVRKDIEMVTMTRASDMATPAQKKANLTWNGIFELAIIMIK